MGKGFRLRAMTRKPDSAAALALAAAGVELVRGDLDDAASLKAALAGAWGTLAVQNTWEAGVEKEEEQGKRFATIAREVGVQHFVYQSVGSAHRKTGIPHFDNKARIEDTVRSLNFPSHVILRPVFFMENLLSPWFLNGDKLYAAMKPTTVLQMIAVSDIGQYGARAFTDAATLNRREIDIAGDAVTIPQAAAVLTQGAGPDDRVRADSDRGGPQEQRGLRAHARVVRPCRVRGRHPGVDAGIRHPADDARGVGGHAARLTREEARPPAGLASSAGYNRRVKPLTSFAVLLAGMATLVGAQGGRPDAAAVAAQVREFRRAHEAAIVGELTDLLAIPNVASDTPNIRRNAALLEQMLARRGFRVTPLPVPDRGPVIVAELPAAGATRTVLFYAHYDGQPVDPAAWTDTEPFTPALRTESIVGRRPPHPVSRRPGRRTRTPGASTPARPPTTSRRSSRCWRPSTPSRRAASRAP